MNPLIYVGIILAAFTLIFLVAFLLIKDKKEAFGFERNMKDGEITKEFYRSPELNQEEIIKLCEMFNARAYIKLNYCDSKKIGLQMLKHVADCILSGNDNFAKRAYDSCCGRYSGDDKSVLFLSIMCTSDSIKSDNC